MPAGSPADASGNDMDATLMSLGQHQSESDVVQGRAPGAQAAAPGASLAAPAPGQSDYGAVGTAGVVRYETIMSPTMVRY